MVMWAEKQCLNNDSDSFIVRPIIDELKIIATKKSSLVVTFQCPRGHVQAKVEKELKAKGFPSEVIQGIVAGIDEVSEYEDNDAHFHDCPSQKWSLLAASVTRSYHYGIWTCASEDRRTMNVELWAVNSQLVRNKNGPVTTQHVTGLKKFMVMKTRDDVPAIAAHAHKDQNPEQHMIAYASKCTQSADARLLLESAINKMGISGEQNFITHFNLKIARRQVVNKVQQKLSAKKFPQDVITAVCLGLDYMGSYKKKDEHFEIKDNGNSTFYKFAVFCKAIENDEVQLSMLCVYSSFKRNSTRPMNMDQIDAVSAYLGFKGGEDVLAFHCPNSQSTD